MNRSSTWLALTGCQVDLETGRVEGRDEPVSLTTREVDLLRFLSTNAGRVVSRDEILTRVWGYSDQAVSRACDNAVKRLRAKIEVDPTRPDHIVTVHGIGYRFVARGEPVTAPPPVRSKRPVVAFGSVRIDLDRSRALRPEGEIELNWVEVAILEVLLGCDAVVDRRTLSRAVWGDHSTNRALDNAISALRPKIEPDPERPRFLLTVRGEGHRLVRPVDPTHDPDLIGRSDAVAQGLAASSRWVLLTGPAGVGKSRLARHLAAHSSTPAVFVDLGSVSTTIGGAVAVGSALGVEFSGDPVDILVRALAHRAQTLLVLDNLDSAPAALAVLVTEILRAAPQVRLLGTSRVRLGVDGERVIEVEPLGEEDAISLFLRRVAAASPGVPLRPDDPTVRELVQRLDRLPLALELAAPRLRVLSPKQLLARLDPALLVHPLAVDPRHRSLAAAVTASFEGLPPEAAEALAQLALFSTGFFVDDAEGLLGPKAIDLLQILRDHSLLRLVDDSVGMRFSTWNIVREQIPLDPERVRRHCVHMARRGTREHIFELFTGPARSRHQAHVDEDIAAARLAIGLGDGPTAARCALAALATLCRRGPLVPGIELVDEVLVLPIPGELRAQLLLWKGHLLRWIDRGPLEATLREAASLAEEHGDMRTVSTALHEISSARRYAGDNDGARQFLHDAIEASRVEAWWNTGLLEASLAGWDDDDDAVREQLNRCVVELRTWRKAPETLSVALDRLAQSRRTDGRLREAIALAKEADELLADLGNSVGRSYLLPTLMSASYELGDAEGVERWGVVALDLQSRVPNPIEEASTRAKIAQARLWSRTDGAAELERATELFKGSTLLRRAWLEDIRAQWCAQRGDHRGVEVAAQTAAEIFAAHEEKQGVAFTARHQTRIALAEGDLERAQVFARQMLGALGGGAYYDALVACVAGELAAAAGDRAEAERWRIRARQASPESSGTNELAWAQARLTRLL